MWEYDNDHTKQYRLINGSHVRISFSKVSNPELFGQISDILLSYADSVPSAPHICRTVPSDDRIASS